MGAQSETLQVSCKACREQIPDLLLEHGYAAEHPELATHLAECDQCREEVRALHSTFAALDSFVAPEPSQYFDSRLRVRLREAQDAHPEGFWERARSFVLFSTGRSFRPALTGALGAVLLLAGGGTLLELHHPFGSLAPLGASSTVNDLKVLDNNAQAEQQMGQLLDQSGAEDGEGDPST